MHSFPKQRTGSEERVSTVCKVYQPVYLDEPIVDFQVSVSRNGPTQFSPSIHQPRPFHNLPQ